MKNLTRIVLIGLAGAVLVSTVAVLTRRAVHAALNTLNPTAARVPWSNACSLEAPDDNVIATCGVAAPAGAELVIQTVSFIVVTSGPSTPVEEQVATANNGTTAYWVGQSITLAVHVVEVYSTRTTSSTILYADPGSSVTCSVTVNHHSDFVDGACYLTGYYVPSS